MLKNVSLLGGVMAAMAAGVYVLWGPTSDKKRMRKGFVPGLLNLGNTCFLNALLQGLASCPSFIRWLQFLAKEHRHREGTELSMTLLQFLEALSSHSPVEDGVLDAGSLLDVLRLQKWHIGLFEEQDAHELFHVLTTTLQEEWDSHCSVTHLFDVQSLETNAAESEQTAPCCRGRVGAILPIPAVWKKQNPFHGRLMSFMACKFCKQQSPVRYDCFDSLSLSIPSACLGQVVTLNQCLQHFISSETIKEVECVTCTKASSAGSVNGHVGTSQRTTFVKQLKLGKLPHCLCIHLQRLTWSNEGAPIKRHEHVQFAEYLPMGSFKHNFVGTALPRPSLAQPGSDLTSGLHCNSTASASASLASSLPPELPPTHPFSLLHSSSRSLENVFRLTAVVVHHGSTHSGHFITYRRSPPPPRTHAPLSSQWLWVSDDSVRKASLQEVLSANAYLLFYESVNSLTPHTDV